MNRAVSPRLASPAAGFVAIEFVAGVALLFVPVLLLVAALPTWSEREHAAVVAAREAARSAAADWPNVDIAAARAVAEQAAVNLGVPVTDLTVSVSPSLDRGGQIRATVTVVMPALVLPGIGTHAAWHWTTSYALRVDDYRSR